MKYKLTLQEKLKDLRIANGLSLEQLASETGISRSALKLDDKTVEVLKTRHFNHRLLCEIIKHPAFEKFLADIEIYIDGIATSQIHTLNSIVDFARQQIMEKYHPDGKEYTMRELNACSVDEYQYFLHNIQSDLGEIIRELRHNHAGDPETASEVSIVEELKKDIKAYSETDSSDAEKQFAILCKRCGINYSKVPDMEKQCVIRFLRRSGNFRPL